MTQSVLAACLLKTASILPDATAMAFSDVHFTYAQFKDLVATFSLKLQQAGLAKYDRLLIESGDPAVDLPACLAAAHLGIPITNDRNDKSAIRIVTQRPDDLVRGLIVDGSFSPANFSRKDKEAIWQMGQASPDEHWFFSPQNRYARSARGAALTQREVLSAAEACRDRFRDTEPVAAVLYPPSTYEGLTRRMATILGCGMMLETLNWGFFEENDLEVLFAPGSAIGWLTGAEASRGLDRARCEVLGLRLGADELESLASVFDEVTCVFEKPGDGPILWTDFDPVGHSWQQSSSRSLCVTDGKGQEARLGYLTHSPEPGRNIVDKDRMGIIAERLSDGRIDLLAVASSAETVMLEDAAVPLTLVDAVLSSVDGIRGAIAFENPKPSVPGLLAFAIFAEGTNREQVVQRAARRLTDHFGAGAVPQKIRPIDNLPLTPDGDPDRALCQSLILRAARQAVS